MESLISILRKPDGLTALLSHRAEDLEPDADEPTAPRILRRIDNLYQVVERPLDETSTPGDERQRRALASWNVLGAVRSMDAATLFHVLIVLLETVRGDIESAAVLPPLPEPEETAKQPKPTAAHPRAYQGTKYKPPKPRSFEPINLRPYLCDPHGEKQILAALGSYRASALEMLVKAGYKADNLETLLPQCDPYCVVHHDGPRTGSLDKLPPTFRTYILPLLRGIPWAEILRFLPAYWSLQLDEDTPLLHAVGRLFIVGQNCDILHWFQRIVEQPPERRLRFTTILIDTGGYLLDPESLSAGLEEWDRITPEKDYAYWLACLFCALGKGVSFPYLLDGFRLARRCEEEDPGYKRFHFYFHKIEQNGFFPADAVEDLLDHIRPSADYYSTLRLQIWKACGELEGLGLLLTHIDWRRFSPDMAFEYLGYYVHFLWDEADNLTPEAVSQKWKFIRNQAPALDALLSSVPPEYQPKVVKDLRDFRWYWDRLEELKTFMPLFMSHLQRVAQPPFKKVTDSTGALRYLLEHTSGALRDQIMAAPDSSFLHLEKACLRKNNAWLVREGIGTLSLLLPAFTVECFLHFPAKLCRTARLLGSLEEHTRRAVTRSFADSPLMSRDIAGLPIAEMAEWVRDQCGSELSLPLPRSLQDHLVGKGSLTEGQTQRALAQVEKNLYLTRLEALDRERLRALEETFGIPAQDPTITHALQMAGMVEENRRSFRKFLKAYWKGDQEYLLSHPLTRQWLARHPKISLERWLAGIPYSKHDPLIGSIRIEVEQDPLEALKLGDYAGSCLGLGGNFSYSAVAVVLDVNKQVLYARNSEGAVIARQLLALSEEDQLVCFSVYPAAVPNVLQGMFHEYDSLLAQSLGVERYAGSGDYTIRNILSQEWWDDCAWNYEDGEVSLSTPAGKAAPVRNNSLGVT